MSDSITASLLFILYSSQRDSSKVRSCHFSTQNSPVVFQPTQRKSQNLFNDLQRSAPNFLFSQFSTRLALWTPSSLYSHHLFSEPFPDDPILFFIFIYLLFFFDDPILNWKPPLHPSPHHDPTRLIITIIQHTTQSFVYSLSPTSRTQASWLQNFLSDFVWFTTVTPTPMAHSRHSVSNCWMTEYLLPFHLNFLLLWLSPFTHFVHIS